MFRASLFFLGIYLAYLGFMWYNTTQLIDISRENIREINILIDENMQ